MHAYANCIVLCFVNFKLPIKRFSPSNRSEYNRLASIRLKIIVQFKRPNTVTRCLLLFGHDKNSKIKKYLKKRDALNVYRKIVSDVFYVVKISSNTGCVCDFKNKNAYNQTY